MNTLDLDEDADGASTGAGTAAPTDIVDEDGTSAIATISDIIDEDVDILDKLPGNAFINSDGSITMVLLFPRELQIRKAGKIRVERYEKLTFRRLNGADQRAISAASDEMTNVVAFSRSTGIKQTVMNVLFDKLDLADIDGAARCLASFLKSGRKTGRSN